MATWGTDPQFTVDLFCPSNSDNPAFVRWYGRFERQSATQADIRRQVESIAPLDVVSSLAEITAPTLVISGRYDEATPLIAETVHRGMAGSEWVLFENSSPHRTWRRQSATWM